MEVERSIGWEIVCLKGEREERVVGWSEDGLGFVCFLQLKGKEESNKGNRRAMYTMIG